MCEHNIIEHSLQRQINPSSCRTSHAHISLHLSLARLRNHHQPNHNESASKEASVFLLRSRPFVYVRLALLSRSML